MSPQPVPRRASTRGGPFLFLVLTLMVPGLLVAVPFGVMMIRGDIIPPGQLGQGYAMAAGISAVVALLFGLASAHANKVNRPALDAAAESLGLRVEGARYMGETAILGVVDGVALELAVSRGSKGRLPSIVGTAASPSPGGLKLWAFAPAKHNPPFGTPPLPPLVAPEEGGGWQCWGVAPATVLGFVREQTETGGSVDEQGTRVTAVQQALVNQIGSDELMDVARYLLAAHRAWAPPAASGASAAKVQGGPQSGGRKKKRRS